MKTVLVIGGYGGFGARMSVLLARNGWAVLVAGRSRERAGAFCDAHPGLRMEPLVLDRGGDLASVLRERRPFLVVDAAGPFQGSDYRVAEACIAAGCHYADLADARDFVCGIGRLDAAARIAGVCVISGASSVPALTGAVADALAAGLDRVTLIDVALSASNRASGSRSVTAAILSYVGKPIRLWCGGRWAEGWGWQEFSRVRFVVPGERTIRRHVALCDVPDLELLPARYPGRPAVRFRAGTELAVQNLLLWLLSWPARWGWVRSLVGLTGLGTLFQQLLRPIGGDCSAMAVVVKGWVGERAIERRWTVYAQDGDGPWIPAIAVPLLAERLASGEVQPGAQPALGLIELAGFERIFGAFAIQTACEEREVRPLYRRIMGPSFDRLPPAVRAMHLVAGDAGADGEADVTAGSAAARLVARSFGLPAAGTRIPLHVWMSEKGGVETWTRNFGASSFASRLSQRGPLLVEQFGPFRFGMELAPERNGLSMPFRRWWIGPMPMPRLLGPRVRGMEEERDGLFHFDVEIMLPLIGLLTRYRGWLRPRTAEASAGRAVRRDPRSLPA